ncbi:hypothetical protein F5141DRAFT_101664 [Pisolithus sp. B1]|nr:hypothetical protein F5141DRAFT_101664 [Pisolithus sp. B1]
MDSADDVSQKRGELDRCPPGHNGRDVALCRLAAAFHRRYENNGEIDDLNEAIALYRAALELRPVGHADRASSLHDIAQCLASRFRHSSAMSDLDEAISAEREVLLSLKRGDPGFDASRRCLADYVPMRTKKFVAMASSDALGVTGVDIERVIRMVAFDTLQTMPTRLLHTPTGILCNRDAQISDFMGSERCKQLVSLCKSYDGDQQMELIRTEILGHFQYVALSHRWGEGEPSLHDIEGRNIYDMSLTWALGKLQTFCTVALKQDYSWAWSDTCCIDSHNSTEVQETIASMFVWYRQSALTIVYLSDVADTDSFVNSEWFKRGWTLQELLAPRTILFYTRDWSLYRNIASFNHKMDAVVLDELETATGIESRFLTNFSPGMDNARLRLQWASKRRTTRPEDIAYSLFGIFDVRLPILYGESAEGALGRLLVNIISLSGDISVLDWAGAASSRHSCLPASITSYAALLPAEEQSSTTSEGTSLFGAVRKLCDSVATSLVPRFLRHSPIPAIVASPIQLLTFEGLRSLYGSLTTSLVLGYLGPYAPEYDFHSLTRAPLPFRLNHGIALPCFFYRVTAIRLTGEDGPPLPSYKYTIRASGLRPVEIEVPNKIEDATTGALLLARPWHSNGQHMALDTPNEEQLLLTLGRPFHALLLMEVPHSTYKRIAPSTFITARAIDSASILQSRLKVLIVV